MPSTVLAVDDSVTLRKVLEITFAGPEFRIVTANSADAALQKLKSDKPDVVIADVSLEPKNGYDLCKAIKQASPSTPVLILSSKHNPFDQGKASAAQADDHIDKPFDTQVMIDKVKKLLGGATDAKPEPAKPVAAATPAPAAVQPKATAPAATPAPAQAVARSPAAPPAAAGAAGAGTPGSPLQRAKTLIYTAGTPAPGAPAGGGAPAAATAPAAQGSAVKTVSTATAGNAPARQPAAAAAAPAAAAAAASLAGTGQIASRLEGLGLTPAQVDAVAAISRDVVERIVWEVVPVLAESLIKEEIARLTK
ncbi:response regulator [Chondromyces apiculatus]|uniref:Response regulator receiver protein n=1 Tax=Chondromyces apiculatus DSM 436 TaxID=1192034 RepID=A0A017T9J2_9BACT|nr:response regulator [Chondromyces apiculatus]EYF05572.1 response regulator receiver protein [Chondromyces apiculatus DSM 436]